MGIKHEVNPGGVDRTITETDDSWLDEGNDVIVEAVEDQPHNEAMVHVTVRSADEAHAGKTVKMSFIKEDCTHKVGDTITL